jgi:hypothetical protein
MSKLFNTIIFAAALSLTLPSVTLAGSGSRVSPHESLTNTIDGNLITLTYGRPYTKDPKTGKPREIWGTLVPWGQPWRMGADEATTLTIKLPIVIGDTTIPAGSYTLYMVPDEKGTSKMAFCKKTGQWGIPVDTKDDLTRVDLKKESLDANVDQYVMALETDPSGGGKITFKWEKAQYSVAFTVKKQP